MTAYFIRRFLLIIPTFLGITMCIHDNKICAGQPMEKVYFKVQTGVEGSVWNEH